MSAETERLQALFAPFNETGAFIVLAEDGMETLNLGLVDSFLVTRVAGDAFWLFFKMVGYDAGWQFAHTIKVVSWSQEDVYLLDLVDDLDRRFHVEQIFPETEQDLVEAWRRWRAYRKKRAELFEVVDAELLAQHMEIALGWGTSEPETREMEERSTGAHRSEMEDGIRLRYMVESKLRALNEPFEYDPIGVWVEGPGEGLDFVIRYLPGYDDEQANADAIRERMLAAGMRGIPDGWMEYHQEQFSPYRGDRGAIITTEEFSSPEECARAILDRIKAERAKA